MELAAALEAAGPLIAGGALLILEHAKRDAAPVTSGPLVRTREIVSGDSALALYQRSGAAGSDKGGDAASNKD